MNATLEDYGSEARFCQKLDRILTANTQIEVFDSEKTSIKNLVGVAGQSGNRIYINFGRVRRNITDKYGDGADERFVVSFKGLNYHELGHHIYTHFNRDVLVDVYRELLKTVKTEQEDKELHEEMNYKTSDVMRAYNILEDARIENLLSVEYPNMERYFTFNVYTHIIKEKNNDSFDKWLLTVGRVFIPRKTVKLFERQAMALKRQPKYKPELFERIEGIFIKFNVASDPIVRGKLARELMLAMSEANAEPKAEQTINTQSAVGGTKRNDKNAEKSAQKLKRAVEEMKKQSAEAEKQADTDTKGKTDEKIQDQEADEEMTQQIEEIEGEMSDEIAGDMEVIYTNGGMSAGSKGDLMDDVPSTPFNPNPEDAIVSKRLIQVIRKLRNGMESAYVRQQKSGAIDVRRIMASRGNSVSVFKKYKSGRIGKSRMGVALLIDGSGSMDGEPFARAMSSAWAINSALERCNDKVMISIFGSVYKVVKPFYNRNANWEERVNGGSTRPNECLKHASKSLRILRDAENIHTNLAIILTDGVFDDDGSEVIIAEMRKSGIHTVMIFVGEDKTIEKIGKENLQHGADELHIIKETRELERVVRESIARIQMKIRNSR